MLDLLAAGRIPTRGFVRQEDIGLDAFLSNRFGYPYIARTDGDVAVPTNEPIDGHAGEVVRAVHETGYAAASAGR